MQKGAWGVYNTTDEGELVWVHPKAVYHHLHFPACHIIGPDLRLELAQAGQSADVL